MPAAIGHRALTVLHDRHLSQALTTDDPARKRVFRATHARGVSALGRLPFLLGDDRLVHALGPLLLEHDLA